ncbi:MAG: CehA/McbA family metallohydrolase [Anaerolineae bacterium]
MSRLEVSYSFDESHDQVVDMGLFDPRGIAFLAGDGFRGWSGSARRRAVLTESAATPGYLPGPLLPGRWHVILGLYRIAPGGCACTVTVTLDDGPGDVGALAVLPAVATPPFDARPRAGPAWFAGDLHCHSHHSDARGSLADIAAEARARGLDFVAVADHSTVSQQAHLSALSSPDFVLLPAQEVSTYYGHLNAWGAAGWLDFRARTDADMARIITEGHQRGLLVSANHPDSTGRLWKYSLDLPFDCFEVWNGPWSADNALSLASWDRMLCAGRRVVAVGGSDYHMPEPQDVGTDEAEGLGRPTTWVYADDLTPQAILAGLRAGHASISASRDGPRLWLIAETADGIAMQGDRLPAADAKITCRVSTAVDGVLLLITTEGVVEKQAVRAGETSVQARLDMAMHGYVRAELRRNDSMDTAEAILLALTNPILQLTG